MSDYTPRPTVYRGIKMRSRLEADFARFLDSDPGIEQWSYEPQCFASPAGQYLPDFQINGVTYIEVKPATISVRATEKVLRQMEIVWDSEPDMGLMLVRWVYGRAAVEAGAYAGRRNGPWQAFIGDDIVFWPGELGEGRLSASDEGAG